MISLLIVFMFLYFNEQHKIILKQLPGQVKINGIIGTFRGFDF